MTPIQAHCPACAPAPHPPAFHPVASAILRRRLLQWPRFIARYERVRIIPSALSLQARWSGDRPSIPSPTVAVALPAARDRVSIHASDGFSIVTCTTVPSTAT
jgi:hypothetical protein